MKRIILCSDGTGNSGGKGRGTNVWKMYKAIDRHDHEVGEDELEQVAIHDDGVGTSDFKIFKAVGGAVGWGLGRNIRDLYRALARSYEPGDVIYLFGFSRGAFTVRSLAGMISDCGIIDKSKLGDKPLEDRVDDAYRAYRKSEEHAAGFRKRYAVSDPEFAPNGKPRIYFVGVWDTVDAVGVPFDWMRRLIYVIARQIRRPHNHDVTPQMVYGFHAIALDEERRTFDPVMWDERKAEPHQRIEQVWFSGVHSNVGGGYPKQGLSTVALDWMMEKAGMAESAAGRKMGLRYIDSERIRAREEADVHARLYDSRSGLAAYFRYRPRQVERICAESCTGLAKIHESVLHRLDRATDGYAPTVIPMDFDVVTTGSGHDEPAAMISNLLNDQAGIRMASQAALDSKVKTRSAQYVIFMIITFGVAGLAGYFQMVPSAFEGFFPDFNNAIRTPPEGASLALKIPAWIYNAIPGLLNGLIPASWESVVDGLFDRVDVTLGISGLLTALLVWRQKVKRSMKQLSLKTWEAVIDAAQAKAETAG